MADGEIFPFSKRCMRQPTRSCPLSRPEDAAVIHVAAVVGESPAPLRGLQIRPPRNSCTTTPAQDMRAGSVSQLGSDGKMAARRGVMPRRNTHYVVFLYGGFTICAR